MSQYPSMPPPGTYIPPSQGQSTPSQGYGAQHQQQGYQQPQTSMSYQSSVQGHGQPIQSQRGSGGTFGQMMNQAVTTGKPMLNKLSKTISSKLGNKQPSSGAPQHLHSYQTYQQHHGQSSGQNQSYTFTQQTQQHQQPQAPSAYPSQQSHYQNPSYSATQGNYLTQQPSPSPQTPYTQTPPPQQQHSPASYNGAQIGPGGGTLGDQYAQAQQGQYNQGSMGQAQPQPQGQAQPQPQGQYQQQPLQAQHTGQQMGVVGGSQSYEQSMNTHSTQALHASPNSPAPQQPQWHTPHIESGQSPATAHLQQHDSPGAPAQSYFTHANPQVQPIQQQWTPLSPTGSEGQTPSHQTSVSVSSPPLPVETKPPPISSVSPPQPQHTTLAPQHAAPQSEPPTEFIAELPGDMGSLSITEAKPSEHVQGPQSGQSSPYQAYQSSTAQPGSPSPGFTIARRSVSTSNMPYADPWRFADPLTELPTREFYVIADLLFDALDRKYEPQNTGLLEASKILKSWIDLTEDAIQLFSYKSYSAFGKMWSLQGIPHVMVPCQTSLSPIWNFNLHSHAQELKLPATHAPTTNYATYMPALNRAGWYKSFFLEMMHGPDNINKLMPALCRETYKPGVMHHPDLAKRDKAEAPALQARAAEIQSTSINQVCNEIKAAMLAEPRA